MRSGPFVILMLLTGCNAWRADVQPAIEFTKVPPANEGGPDTQGTIAGRVTGARSSQRIVLYAKAGPWWIQPTTQQPFTKIHPDRTWTSPTHLGTEYAAILVDAEYKPPNITDNLPKQGGQVAAVATVKAEYVSHLQPPTNTLQFSGYEWKIRTAVSNRNGLPHRYDPANAKIDSSGFLHLGMTFERGQWTCSEATLMKSLGYGTYLFTVRDVSHLEPTTIFSAFTWDDLGTDQNHSEMDIEISRWGDAGGQNGRFVVQPFYVPANVSQFTAPAGQLTYTLHWEPGRATFQTLRGSPTGPKPHVIAQKVFAAGIPLAGSESARMNFCAVNNPATSQQHESEVVIENFQYLP